MRKIFTILTTVTILASCSYKPIQTVKVQADINYLKNSEVGNNKPIELLVFDLRPSKEYVGKKQWGKKNIDIRSDVNIANLLQEALIKGLKINSFVIGKGKILEVHLEELKYQTIQSFIGKSEAKIDLKVIVRNSVGSIKFSKNYQTEITKKHFISPTAKADAETINFIVNQSIKNVLEDDNLMKLLTEK